MAESLTIEILDETTLEVTAQTARKVTKFAIGGLTTTDTPDPEVLWRAITYLSGLGYTFNTPLAGHTALTLQRIVIKGYTTDGVVGFMYFETPFFGGPASALIVRRHGGMTQHTSNTFVAAGGARLPIKVAGITLADGSKVDEDYADISGLDPLDVLNVTGLTYGAPSGGGVSVRGYVNNATWQGFPAGYWLCTEFDTDISQYQGYYTFAHTAVTRVTKDWGELARLRNDKTGKYVKIDSGDETFLSTAPYTNALNGVPGAVKVGRYPMTYLGSAFGLP